jgi:hypothetical protein
VDVNHTTEQVRDLLTVQRPTPAGRARSEHVELRLTTGEVLEGTLDHGAAVEADTAHVTIRSKTWSRWRGTPDDLLRIVEVAREQIAKLTQQTPTVSIQVEVGGKGDREQYFDVESFRRDIQARDAGSPGGRLGQIQQLQITVGGSGGGGYLVTVVVSRALPAPGISLTAEGADPRPWPVFARSCRRSSSRASLASLP